MIPDTVNQLLTGEANKRPTRSQWTVQEKHYLQRLVEATMDKKRKDELINNADWEQIALKLNQRFEGKLCGVGQGFVPPKNKVLAVQFGRMPIIPRQIQLAVDMYPRMYKLVLIINPHYSCRPIRRGTNHFPPEPTCG